jgi:hypothetical protein
LVGDDFEKKIREKYTSLDSPYQDLLGSNTARLRKKYANNYSSLKQGMKDVPKRDYYCPFTRNKKFELFLEDLFDLGFDHERNR